MLTTQQLLQLEDVLKSTGNMIKIYYLKNHFLRKMKDEDQLDRFPPYIHIQVFNANSELVPVDSLSISIDYLNGPKDIWKLDHLRLGTDGNYWRVEGNKGFKGSKTINTHEEEILSLLEEALNDTQGNYEIITKKNIF